MQSKSDKPLVRNWIIACIGVILVFHFAWAKYLFINFTNGLFTIVDGILIGAFISQCIGAYNNADDPNKDSKRWAFIILALAVSTWAAGWSTALSSKMAQHIAG